MPRTVAGFICTGVLAAMSCGPQHSPTAPHSPGAASSAPPGAYPRAAPIAVGSEPEPEPGPVPQRKLEIPQPFVVVARAGEQRSFEILAFEDAAFVAACFEDVMSGGCLQPRLARVVDGELVPGDELLVGLPPLRMVNLAAEPKSKFRGIGPKADWVGLARQCLKGSYYPGPRVLTGVYGRLENNAWAVVTSFGEEPANQALGDVYRWDGSAWRHVYSTADLHVHVQDLVSWRGGALLLTSSLGGWKFSALQARRGAPVPAWPKDLAYGEHVLRGFGNSRISGYYSGLEEGLSVLTWSRASSRPIRLDLPRITQHEECAQDRYADAQVEIHSAVEMTVRAMGGLPVDKPFPEEGMDPRPVQAKVKLVGGRLRVIEQRELNEAEAAEFCAGPEPLVDQLRAHDHFEVRRHWRIGDDLYVSVRVSPDHAEDADEPEENLLLRSRAAARIWILPDEELLQPPRPPSDPECEKRMRRVLGPRMSY
jgi:hypothetical protein